MVRTRLRPLTPWFDSECRAARHECRQLERRFRHSLHDVDRQAWISALRRKHVLFEAKKNDYWTSRVAAEGHNPRLLWRSLNNVLHRGTESGLPSAPVSHSADDFQTFFQYSQKSWRSNLLPPFIPQLLLPPRIRLVRFMYNWLRLEIHGFHC